MDVNNLKTNKLTYEIAIRGIDVPRTAEERRRLLCGILAQERKGIFTGTVENKFVFDDDIAGIEETIADLLPKIKNFSVCSIETEYCRIVTRVSHLNGRIQNLHCTGDVEIKKQHDLMLLILGLEDDLDAKIHSIELAM